MSKAESPFISGDPRFGGFSVANILLNGPAASYVDEKDPSRFFLSRAVEAWHEHL